MVFFEFQTLYDDDSFAMDARDGTKFKQKLRVRRLFFMENDDFGCFIICCNLTSSRMLSDLHLLLLK